MVLLVRSRVVTLPVDVAGCLKVPLPVYVDESDAGRNPFSLRPHSCCHCGSCCSGSLTRIAGWGGTVGGWVVRWVASLSTCLDTAHTVVPLTGSFCCCFVVGMCLADLVVRF